MEAVHKRVSIRGKVQGVYFRASARAEALSLDLRGLVRNEPDGSVYAEVEGSPAAVEAFLAWCRRGPEQAVVHEVIVGEGPLQGFADFSIRR